MRSPFQSVIVATGSCIPDQNISNDDFLSVPFFEKDGSPILKDNASIVRKFKEITGICSRRYARPEQNASDLGFIAAQNALDSSGIDKELLDYIIVAHNFGDVDFQSNRSDMVPSLASRVKYLLQIKNPDCVAYDLPFGCPGWVEGVIQANYYIRSGDAKYCLVIGAETLSRVFDEGDRDSMLYSDGAGAVILAATEGGDAGILAHKTQTHAWEHALLLSMNSAFNLDKAGSKDIYLKMNGRKLYEFALNHVPFVIKEALDKAGVHVSEIHKVLIHQANEKMDIAILERVLKLYDLDVTPELLMPMSISWLGNSSVATVPTLLDLVLKNQMPEQQISKGDKVVIASVGAGMNINAIVYQF